MAQISSFSFVFLNDFFVYSEIRVEGLEMLDYFDILENGERFTEQGDALTFDGEVPLGNYIYSATNI